jgi:hypothetical protein
VELQAETSGSRLPRMRDMGESAIQLRAHLHVPATFEFGLCAAGLMLISTLQVQAAVKKIASLLGRAGIDDLLGPAEAQEHSADRDKAKKLDVVAVCVNSD